MVLFFIFSLLILGLPQPGAARPVHSDTIALTEEGPFIGWKGEVYNPNGGLGKPRGGGDESKPRWVETVSWSPRAFLFHNFLSHKECDHIVGLANAKVERSFVVDAVTGEARMDPIRTSSGTFFRHGHDDIISAIEHRVAVWSHLPLHNQEELQVLKYVNGQKYDAHWDWFQDLPQFKLHTKGGNRLATVLMYLADVEEGGETVFPKSTFINETLQRDDNVSECAKKGVAVKARKGDAILFWDLDTEAKKGDEHSMHASCPVIKGTKWTATKWIHTGSFAPGRSRLECKDFDVSCPGWAKRGECKKNPSFMVGEADFLGQCRLSCKACKPCEEGDEGCNVRPLATIGEKNYL